MASAPRDTATRSVDTLRPLADLLVVRGYDVADWLAPAGLLPEDLEDIERRVGLVDCERLILAAYERTGDPAMGLHVVQAVGPRSGDLFTYLAATSATGREAFESGTRYVAIVGSDFEYRLEIEGSRTVCSVRSASGDGRFGRFAAEVSVGMMVRFGRVVTSEHGISEAWFRHPAPDYADEYERVLEVPVRFEQRCDGVCGTTANLDRPMPRADSTLQRVLDEQARRLLNRIPPAAEHFSDRVRQVAAEELPSGNPRAEHVAERLRISARTLRRRLRDEGLSYQTLLDGLRRELACDHLRRNELGVGEIAFLLGFSDASAFTKAFRRWTGASPVEWLRRQARDASSEPRRPG